MHLRFLIAFCIFYLADCYSDNNTIGNKVISIGTGDSHSCALFDNGRIKCWGHSHYGQLGLETYESVGYSPNEMGKKLQYTQLGSDKKVQSVQLGNDFGCAILEDQSVKCWGRNHYGQLGQGDRIQRGDHANEMGDNLPTVDLGLGKKAQSLSVGGFHVCAHLMDHSVKCWGRNVYGQLGYGHTLARGDDVNEMGERLLTVSLGTGRSVLSLASGREHNCAILDNHSVKCWGYNANGILGLEDAKSRGDNNNEMGDNLPPVDLGTGKTALALAAGYFHNCAILNDYSVKCWGYNFYGQLGLGDTVSRGDQPGEMGDNLPTVDLGLGKKAISISAGSAHTCVLLNDLTVKCWGSNEFGQLGLGDRKSRGDEPGEMGERLPATDLGISASKLSVGSTHGCAILSNNAMKCWGTGPLGLGDFHSKGVAPSQMGQNLPFVNLWY